MARRRVTLPPKMSKIVYIGNIGNSHEFTLALLKKKLKRWKGVRDVVPCKPHVQDYFGSGMFPCRARNVGGRARETLALQNIIQLWFGQPGKYKNLKDESSAARQVLTFAMLGGSDEDVWGDFGVLETLALEELLPFGEHPLFLDPSNIPQMEFEIRCFLVKLPHLEAILWCFFFRGWTASPVKSFPGDLKIGRIQIPLSFSWKFPKRAFTDQILGISRSWGHLHAKKYTNPSWKVLGEALKLPPSWSLWLSRFHVKVRGYGGFEDM